MINAKELMLGNYVEYNPDHVDEGSNIEPLEVILINGEDGTIKLDDGFENYYGEVELNPVKLTPELLDKAGFEINDDNYAVRGDYRIYCKDSNVYFLQAYYGDDQGWIQLPGNLYSLHQLQNVIFALTGEEIEIKL